MQPLVNSRWLQIGHAFGTDHGIRLEMPAGMPVATVELFDLRGHRVGVLGTGLEAGRIHDLKLPKRIPGGVYLVRARAGDQQQTGRVVVVP